jgi:hypothetical protein
MLLSAVRLFSFEPTRRLSARHFASGVYVIFFFTGITSDKSPQPPQGHLARVFSRILHRDQSQVSLVSLRTS